MRQLINVVFLLCIGLGMTAHAADRDPPKVVKINDSKYA